MSQYNSLRSRSASETLDEYLPQAQKMGITRIANITGLDQIGIPVYICCRPNSKGLSLSQGKGITHDDAKISAYMEAVETYHAENLDEKTIRASLKEMGNRNICDVKKLPIKFSKGLSLDTTLRWIKAVDVFSEKEKWVPLEMVDLDYTIPQPEDFGFFDASSNGLASGNTVDEAIIHGTLEIVERDAKSYWNALSDTEQLSTKLSIETIQGTYASLLINKLNKAPIDFGLWEITSSNGIPTFLCRIIPNVCWSLSGIRAATGMGTHLNKEIALIRAITEAAQSRLTFISGARDDISYASYKKYHDPELYKQWKCILNQKGQNDYRKIPDFRAKSHIQAKDLIFEKTLKENIGEVLFVDITKEDIGIPVVRMVASGAQGYSDLNSKPTFIDTINTYKVA